MYAPKCICFLILGLDLVANWTQSLTAETAGEPYSTTAAASFLLQRSTGSVRRRGSAGSKRMPRPGSQLSDSSVNWSDASDLNLSTNSHTDAMLFRVDSALEGNYSLVSVDGSLSAADL